MRFYSLKEIEGKISPHTSFLERELERRKEPFKFIKSPEEVSEFTGGEVFEVGIGESWALRKEFFPGVSVIVLYFREDEEFPSKLSSLFSGDRIKDMKGEDLVELTLCLVNHILRFLKLKGVKHEMLERV